MSNVIDWGHLQLYSSCCRLVPRKSIPCRPLNQQWSVTVMSIHASSGKWSNLRSSSLCQLTKCFVKQIFQYKTSMMHWIRKNFPLVRNMCVTMANKNQKKSLEHIFLFSLPPSRETMQRRHCWKDLSHPTYVLALSSTNRSAELSPPPTGRAYIRRRWTLSAQSTLGGCRGRWGGGGGESPFGEADKILEETEGQ